MNLKNIFFSITGILCISLGFSVDSSWALSPADTPTVLKEEAPTVLKETAVPTELKEGDPTVLKEEDPTALKKGDPVTQTASTYKVTCKDGKVCRVSETELPLRVLPRPRANLYTSKSDALEAIAKENMKAFSPLYVFAREDLDFSDPGNPKGWYQVGGTDKVATGWMKAADVMEWRQALVVAYTHPGTGEDARKPVLMFDSLKALQDIVQSDDREANANTIYKAVASGTVPENVISIEPGRFTDIEDNFYILPVLDFESVDLFDDETRLLRLAAAIPNERSSEGDKTTLDDESYQATIKENTTVSADEAQNATADIVFVMDLTGSMGPYIGKVKEAIAKIASTVTSNPALKKKVRFGIVGYRDDTKRMAKLEFVTKNYTPELLSDTDFVKLVNDQVKNASTTSDDYAEEVYAGVLTGIEDISWRSGLRFMILVGDASAHEPGHKQSTTGLGATELRQLADDKNISIFAIHLKNEKFAADHPIAEDQFSALATNPGTSDPAYFPIDSKDHEQFMQQAAGIAGILGTVIKELSGGQTISADTLASSDAASNTGELKKILNSNTVNQSVVESAAIIKKVAAASLVNYLGGKSVRDITFWAMDRDLIDPEKQSLDVRILTSKADLNNLIETLSRIIEALRTAEFAELQFFEALQSVMAQVTKGQDIDFDKAKNLSSTKLMPKWIASLPYKSTILDMNNETYEAMQPDERVALEKNLSAKLQLYVEINENVDAWKALDPRAEETDKVYPLPLEALP
jgi:hypothetical protein